MNRISPCKKNAAAANGRGENHEKRGGDMNIKERLACLSVSSCMSVMPAGTREG